MDDGDFMATARKLPSGSWRVQAYIGTDEDGKKRKKSFTAPTKKEAEYLAAQALIEARNASDDTLGALIDRYIESKTNVLSPTTIQGYKTIRKNNFQSLMDVRVSNVSNIMLQEAVNDEAENHQPKTVKNAFALVHTVLQQNSYTQYNVTLPKAKKKKIVLPEPVDVINAIRDTEIELPCLLAMWLSLRMSEVKGLKKSDIKDGLLTINRVMVCVDKKDVVKDLAKTQSSNRTLKVPKYIQNLIDAVPDEQEYLVTLSRKALYSRLRKCLTNNNIEPISFHDLRHMNATIMMQLGIPDKYAMERGGWETDYVMKSVYQNLFDSGRQEADRKMDEYFDKFMTSSHESSHEDEKIR